MSVSRTSTISFDHDGNDGRVKLASGGTQGTYSEIYTYNSSTGNLASKGGVIYTYGDSDHKHAVTSLSSGWTYQYDPNGNMTERIVSSSTYSLTYDAYNHLVSVSGAASVDIVYDGDGQRVKVDDIVFIGEYYVYSIYGSTNYYLVNGKQIAYGSSTLPKQHTYYFLADHLNSTMVNVTEDRSYIGKEGYKAWGETRYGNLGHRFNGKQYQWNVGGLYYYGARFYDPALGRFTQADTLVPEGVQGSQAWDRYAYVNNNPLRYTDPSGHGYCDLGENQCDPSCWVDDKEYVKYLYDTGERPSISSPFYDPDAEFNKSFEGSVTVSFPIYLPLDSYNQTEWGLDGRQIEINYGRNNYSKGAGVMGAIDVFNVYAGPYASEKTAPRSTIEGSLYYSTYNDGSISFKGMIISNNSNKTIYMKSILIQLITGDYYPGTTRKFNPVVGENSLYAGETRSFFIQDNSYPKSSFYDVLASGIIFLTENKYWFCIDF